MRPRQGLPRAKVAGIYSFRRATGRARAEGRKDSTEGTRVAPHPALLVAEAAISHRPLPLTHFSDPIRK